VKQDDEEVTRSILRTLCSIGAIFYRNTSKDILIMETRRISI